MAESSTKRSLRPARMLATAIMAALALVMAALVWPTLVHGVGMQPVITQVQVTSSKGTFFYSPLTDTGGSVYFNNLSGEGADQVITVTVAVSDDNPAVFSGGHAFGITPSTSVSNTDGTWSVTYTVRSTDTTESGVLFAITDGDSLSNTITITFAQDVTDPNIYSPDIVENSRYLYSVGTGIYYGDDMGSTLVPFTVTGTAYDGDAGLNYAAFSTALGITPPADDSPATWTGVYSANNSSSGNGTIVVTVTDHVGNALTQTFAYTRDTTAPTIPASFVHDPDADSGGDGFAPDTNWEDDLTINVIWSSSTDTESGLRTYHLSTSPYPTAPDVPQNSPITVTTDGPYTLFLNAEDNVGNISADKPLGSIISVDRDAPSGARLNLAEVSGGQYLYIANNTGITGGTLYYNNTATSSFVITGDVSSPFNWGMGSEPWKVAFDASWGDSLTEDTTSPYTHTYTVNPGETDNAFAVSFVNKAGNVQAITIATTLDVVAPTVDLIDVSNPQWDPGGNELDTSNNWYRTSLLTGGWTFTSSVSDALSGLSSSQAVWNHSIPSNNQTIDPGLDGSGTFSNVNDDSDGVVTVTVTLTDHVNNAASDSVVIRLDGTPPTILTGSWAESSPYLFIIGGVLYYNPGMPVTQTATLSGTASDTGSNLDYATFSQPPNLPSTPISDTSPANWSTNYGFNSATQGDHVNVTAYDHVGNAVTATYAYTRATNLPSVRFQNVTDPGYDPVPPECDIQGNWYRSSNFNAGSGAGWWFTSVFTDSSGTGISAVRATWDHATGPDYAITPNLDLVNHTIDGTFQNVSSAPDGLVTVTLTITDNLGQVAADTVVLRVDNAPPNITSGGWSESSPYLFANGSTLYFSQQMLGLAPATLGVTATEGSDGSGLWKAVFSAEPSIHASEATVYSPSSLSNNYTFGATGYDDASSPVAVVVSDHLGNAVTRTYTYTLDTTPPAVQLTDVTNPQYDPVGNELDAAGNWYRTGALGAGWSFTATVTETVAGVGQDQAVWDYQTGTANDRYTTLGLSGAGVFANRTGTFAGVTGTPDGVVTVTLAVTDQVGNVGSDFVVVQLDGSPPAITPAGWSESSPYLYADGDTLYFSNQMGGSTVNATVSGTAADAGVGLSLATFSSETSLSSPGPDTSPAAWSGTYGITSASSGTSSPVEVTVYDLVSNTVTTTFDYVEDTAGPAVSFTDVTNPQYDPDGNELNATGNWYRTSLLTGGWAFTGTIADSLAGPRDAQATWDHASGSLYDQTIDPGLDGDGVFTGVYTNSDGTVVVSLRGTDNVSNATTASLTIRLDNTPPGLPSSFQVTSPGLPGGYYSTTLLSLQWNSASDPSGSGVAAHLLGTTPNPVASYTSPASYNVAGDGVYSFYLRAVDNVGNPGAVTSTGPITVDTHAPAPHIQATPRDSESRILVEWGASDATTWPVAYDVEYSLTGGGNWQGWIANASSTSAYFGPDTPAHVAPETLYCFRMRARDYVNNASDWSPPVCTALGRRLIHLPLVGRNFDASPPYFLSGDFESGTFAGWATGGALPLSIVPHPVLPTGGTPPNGGAYAALLGSPNYGCGNGNVPIGQAYIWTHVIVPAGSSHLRFSYRVISYDVLRNSQAGNEWWDRLEVQANGNRLDPASGNPYGNATGSYGCDNPPHDSGWQEGSLNLSDYAGQTVVLTFFNENHGDLYYNTYSYLDNIRIEVP